MMTPDDIDVWVGLDVGKSAHHAHALDHDGNTLYDKPLKQDEKAIRTMLGKLSKHGRVLLVVDQPNTIGSLPLTVARNMGIAVAYLPGTAMRRTAQLLPGDAKTDRRDAHVIAWAELVKLFVFGVCFINKVPFVRGMRPRVGRGPVSSWSSCAPR